MLCAATVAGIVRAESKIFTSTKYHYKVSYPSSWYLLNGAQLNYLDILSFPPSQRAEGVVLADGGAEISVGRVESKAQTAEDWIEERSKFLTDVNQREIESFTKRSGGCTKLIQVTALEEVGPGRNFSDTCYYCTTANGPYTIMLHNWEGDPHQNDYQRVALRIALSLRSSQGPVDHP